MNEQSSDSTPTPGPNREESSLVNSTRGPEPNLPTGQDAEATIDPVTLVDSVLLPGGPLPDQVGRCAVVRELARGGMGAVLEAIDYDLGRHVAVKVLLPDHQAHSDLRRRFLEEARITGQLQHPGVTPVYGVGQLADARPFFTMKLVQGDTLAALLRQRQSPSEDQPRFLAVFEQVGQTIAFAHSQGVIHRDLKPPNIMVGRFGEVQVMDWGLAKHLKDDTREQRFAADSSFDLQSGQTQAGSVIGTLAYMAPEQARGEIDQLDERCDVFGLGAILCVILTGKPPYQGLDAKDLRRLAEAGRLDDAFSRLHASGADEPLVRLACHCLSPRREDRPRSAGAVAEAVAGYRTGVQERLRAAELAQVEAQARALRERQARRWTLALAASILLTVLLAAGGGLWLARQRAVRIEALHADLRDAERSLAASRWTDARTAIERAEARLAGGGPDDVARRVREARTDLELAVKLETIRLDKAQVHGKGFSGARAVPAYELAFREYGLDLTELTAEEAAERIRNSAIRGRLIAALDDWTHSPPNDDARKARLLDVARLADPDEWRNRFRQLVISGNRKALVQLARRADVASLSPETIVLLGDTLVAAGETTVAIEVLHRAQIHYPQDLWINHDLAVALDFAEPSRAREAIGFYRAALTQRPDSPGIWLNLGWALAYERKYQEAEACYRQALVLKPDFAVAHVNLGTALEHQGRIDEAEASYRRGIALDDQAAPAWNNLGSAMHRKNKLDEALDCFRKAIRLDPEYAEAHVNSGFILDLQGRKVEAIEELRKAIKLQPRFAGAYTLLGSVLVQQEQLEKGLEYLRQAMKLNPKDPEAVNQLGNALVEHGRPAEGEAYLHQVVRMLPNRGAAHYCLGNAFFNQNKLAEAITSFRRAIALEPDLAQAHCNLGLALQHQGRHEEALKCLEKGHALGSKQPGWQFPSRMWVRDARKLLALERKLDEAVAGRIQPATGAEWIELALFTEKYRKAPALAARFYAAAFHRQPELANDVRQPYRYNAACSAVVASLGRDKEPTTIDVRERRRLLRQALTWLDADLRAYQRVLATRTLMKREEVHKALVHWLTDPDLAGLHDLNVLLRLSAEERQASERLWLKLHAVIWKARGKT